MRAQTMESAFGDALGALQGRADLRLPLGFSVYELPRSVCGTSV